ncbi:DinB family protein [Salegentibacter sp. HM20]
MKVTDISSSDYHEFYGNYISKIPNDKDLLQLMELNRKEMLNFLKNLPEEKLLHRYKPEKWSIAELIQHLIDVERIFQYRALSIAREDKISLPGFDHDAYVPASKANRRKLADFIGEFELVRDSGIALFNSFDESMLKERGNMNNAPATTAAIGFIIVGHCMHHLQVIKDRYLK